MSLKELEENKAAQIKLNKEVNAFTLPRYKKEEQLKKDAAKLVAQYIIDEKLLSKHSWKWAGDEFRCERDLDKFEELSKITDYHDWFYPHGSIYLTKNITMVCYDGELSIHMDDATPEEVKKFIDDSQIKLDMNHIDERIKNLENEIEQLKVFAKTLGVEIKSADIYLPDDMSPTYDVVKITEKELVQIGDEIYDLEYAENLKIEATKKLGKCKIVGNLIAEREA